ncbi:MAG: D-glycero-alpha-D-manno-heptose-1,7-bisphosphate 7-phosphatase [Bacteroidia bacterium]
MPLPDKSAIDKSWTLFLDRDGVINVRLPGDYVKNLDEFVILPGVLDAVAHFSSLFGRIIVVTNQQGIGKGLYTEQDLEKIHNHLKNEVARTGGRIDGVYFAPQLASENSPMRKPGIGMALKAKEDFPEIDFSKAIMVGDSSGDMEFARNAGMFGVFIDENASDPNADLPVFSSLFSLSLFLR